MLRHPHPLPSVARWAGHSVGVCASRYAGVIDELEDLDPLPAHDEVSRARVELKSLVESLDSEAQVRKMFANPEAPLVETERITAPRAA
jgi:hypothetical protein